jgi:anaphase-promoting complex subunit 4
MMVAHKVLTTVMDELEHFNAFSIWLRLEIDKQGSSSITEELSEKEATMDHPKVMSYIQYYLANSPLALYFDEVAKEDYIKDQEMVAPGPSLMDLVDKQLQEQEAGRPYMKVLPRIGFLLNYLTTKANAVFDGIADAEKQGVKFAQATEVSIGKKIWKHDLCMGRSSKKVRFCTSTAYNRGWLTSGVLGPFGRGLYHHCLGRRQVKELVQRTPMERPFN